MRAPRLVSTVALVLIGAGCREDLGDAATGAPSRAFGDEQLVSAASGNGATPMFLVTPAGHRVVSWVSAPGGGEAGRLHVAVSHGASALPAVTATIADPLGPIEPHGEAPPVLAADGAGHLYALYAVGRTVPGARFPVSALRLVRTEDGGRTWSAPITVNQPGPHGEFGSHNFHALSAGDDGTIWVVWLENERGRSSVYATRSTDGGRRFAPPRPLGTGEACPCCRTAIVPAPDGAIYVAWRAVREGNVRDVVVARSRDGGATWDPPVRPRDEGWVFDGCPHAGPSLKRDARGRLHIAWWTGKAGEAGVWYAVSDDGGQRWTPQPIATGERSAPAHVQLLVRDANVVVAWDDGFGETPSIRLRRSSDGGRRFGAEERLSHEAAAQYPVLAAVGDSLLVAWRQQTRDAHRRELMRRADMKDPKAVMGLPKVGESAVVMRVGAL